MTLREYCVDQHPEGDYIVDIVGRTTEDAMIRATGAVSVAGLLAMLMMSGVCNTHAADAANAAYPLRPIRLIVPTSTGGGSDLSARLIAQRLFEKSGYVVMVENRAGAGTISSALISSPKRPPTATPC